MIPGKPRGTAHPAVPFSCRRILSHIRVRITVCSFAVPQPLRYTEGMTNRSHTTPQLRPGQLVYLPVSGAYIKEGRIRSLQSGLVTLQFTDTGGAIRVPARRLCLTPEAAGAALGKNPPKKNSGCTPRYSLQLPHNLHELFHVDRTVYVKVPVLEHHEIAVFVSVVTTQRYIGIEPQRKEQAKESHARLI